jgi:ABC-2 type transport system permease protein
VSLRNTLRAMPTLMRVGFADAVAYRAEMLVWVLSTTMPLVNLGLWSSVVGGGSVGGYGRPRFVAYFLATFIVRQLTGCWVFWEMNFAIRNGTLAMRLLRPIDPLLAYAAEALAGMPLRLLVSLPVAAVTLAVLGASQVTHDPVIWTLWAVSVAGAWLMTLLVNFIVGSLSFFMESSVKLMDVWLVLFFAFSGYLMPIDLFPGVLRRIAEWLPFRFQIGFPVELMTAAHDRAAALRLLAAQGLWIAGLLAATIVLWRRGLERFAAYGG